MSDVDEGMKRASMTGYLWSGGHVLDLGRRGGRRMLLNGVRSYFRFGYVKRVVLGVKCRLAQSGESAGAKGRGAYVKVS